ncbi:MAG: hypothetical protein ACI9HK_002236 [Pirellulaceae bacterium]|jgi:hypothetical protein
MLDVHISDSYDTATRTDPVCAFDFEVHRSFFANLVQGQSAFPLLCRMKDYYADCSYSVADAVMLATEIERLLPTVDQRTPHFSLLQQLRRACDSATNAKQTIFVFCD